MKTAMKSRSSKKSFKETLENINPLTDFLYRKLVYDAWAKFSSTILARLKKDVENDEDEYFESGSDESKKKGSSNSESSESSDDDESSRSSDDWQNVIEHGNPHLNSIRSSVSETASDDEISQPKPIYRVNTQHESTINQSNLLLVRPDNLKQRRSLMLPNTVFNFD